MVLEKNLREALLPTNMTYYVHKLLLKILMGRSKSTRRDP